VEAKDVDFWEVNEAFSVVALANAKVTSPNNNKISFNK
jgi:acetyl-CoA acetyltransferase